MLFAVLWKPFALNSTVFRRNQKWKKIIPNRRGWIVCQCGHKAIHTSIRPREYNVTTLICTSELVFWAYDRGLEIHENLPKIKHLYHTRTAFVLRASNTWHRMQGCAICRIINKKTVSKRVIVGPHSLSYSQKREWMSCNIDGFVLDGRLVHCSNTT